MDCMVHGVTKSWTQLNYFHSLTQKEREFIGRVDIKLLTELSEEVQNQTWETKENSTQDPAAENAALNILHITVGTTGEPEHTPATKACTSVGQWQLHFWTLGSAVGVCAQLGQTLRLHGLWPASLPCPWEFPGKNIGVGCHALFWGNLPDPGIETASLASPELAGEVFTLRATWETLALLYQIQIILNNF